jgi:hypothetical protein
MKSFGETNELSGNLGLSVNSDDGGIGGWNRSCPPIECGGAINGNGDVAKLSLKVIGESPNEIYLMGTATIVLSDFGLNVNLEIGGNGGIFTVGKPNSITFATSGNVTGTWPKPDGTASVSYEFDFNLPMPWDGTSANWIGTWSISWTVVPRSAKP